MKTRHMTPLALAVLLTVAAAGPALAANTLDVTNAAAIEGNFGMEVTHDGSTNRVYVQDNSPSCETVYRAEFDFDRNDILIDNCSGTCSNRHVIFLARQSSPATTPFRITLIRFKVDASGSVPRYAIRLSAREDAGNFRFVGGFVLAGAPRTVAVEWTAGSGDGIARLLKNDVVQRELTNLDNDTHCVDLVRLGATSGLTAADALTDGTVYYDSFVSLRSVSP